MDLWDYGLNFSSEIIVAGVVVVIALINLIVFNPLKAEYQHTDSSFAAQLLQRHTNLNPQLAIAQNTISTTIDSGGIFTNAYASNNALLADGDSISSISSDDAFIDDSGITKPNPDSIQRLVSDTVEIYETKPFDTVYTVANQFGVSTQTIRDSNSLPNNALKAGWFLIIPKTDGVAVQVTDPNITLRDIAKSYNGDLNKIISYNGLSGADDKPALNSYLVIPGGEIPETISAPASVIAQSQSRTTASYSPSVPKATIAGNNRFAPGHCTDYVARNVAGITWRGNANQWMTNARRQGVLVNKTPAPGAVIVTNESYWGHVGVIHSVSGTKVTFSEWNYAGLYVKTTRTLDINDPRVKGVIHPNSR